MGYANLQMIKKFYGGMFIEKEKLANEGIKYPIKIEYYKICDNTENKEITKYGLEVIKTEYKNQEINIEKEKVLEITKEERIIDNILDKLKRNQVTPVITKYIVEDLIYEKRQRDGVLV